MWTSCSAATGRIPPAGNSRARARSSFCSSVSANEIPPLTALSTVAIALAPVLIDQSVNQGSDRLGLRQEGRSDRRKPDREAGAAAGLALDLDSAAALPDDPVHRGEAEPGGLGQGLRREERLEEPLERRVVHPDALVGDREDGGAGGRDERERQRPALGHGV